METIHLTIILISLFITLAGMAVQVIRRRQAAHVPTRRDRSPWRREMKPGLRIAGLTLLLFSLLSIDFVGLRLSETATDAPGILLLVALLDTVVVAYTINRSQWRGWRLTITIFLAFYSLTTFLVGIETLYLGNILPPEQVSKLLVNGAIVAAIFSPLAALTYGRLTTGTQVPGSGQQLTVNWKAWPIKLALLAFIWVILFVAFGLLVFTPLASALDPAALSVYANLEMLPWILLFQAGRGAALAGLALLVLAMTGGHRRQAGLTVGLLFGWLMSANLLLASDLPRALRAAHFVEVFGENFIYGWIVTFLFLKDKVLTQPTFAEPGAVRTG